MGLDVMDPSTIGEAKCRISHSETFKVNSDVAMGSGEVGLELLVMENIQPFIGSVELVEAIILNEGVFKALEAGIYPLRPKTDSLIL